MIRRFSIGIFLIGLLASAVPDLINYLMKAFEYDPMLQGRIKQVQEIAKNFPLMLFIFSLTFGAASIGTDYAHRRVGISGLVQFALLVPVGTWLIRFFLIIVSGALVKYGVSGTVSFYTTEIVSTLFLILMAQSVLGIEVGIGGYAAAAAISFATILLPGEPYRLTFIPAIYFTLIGGVISYYLAQHDEKIRRPGE